MLQELNFENLPYWMFLNMQFGANFNEDHMRVIWRQFFWDGLDFTAHSCPLHIAQVLFLEMEEDAKSFDDESRCETETGLNLLALAMFFVATHVIYSQRCSVHSLNT